MMTAEMTIWKNFMTMSTTAMGIWAYCSWPNTGSRAMLTKAQQPPHTLRSQKFVGAFHKISLSFLQNPRLRGFWRKKARRFCNRIYAETPHAVESVYQILGKPAMVVVCKNRLPSGGPEWTIFTMTPGRRSYFAYSSPMSQFSVRPGRMRVRNTKN